MPHLPALHWLWLFGALALGIAVGWLTYLSAATRWKDRSSHIAIGGLAIVVLLAMAKVIPARYGTRLEVGVILAVVGAIGCCVGWVLRDLADFTPAATRGQPAASAVTAGSYLYRDAFAGMGTRPTYMRATTGQGGSARVQLPPNHDDLAKAPAPGGYTFPKALPFADARTDRRAEAGRSLRPHWSWPAARQPATDSPAATSDAPRIEGAPAQAD